MKITKLSDLKLDAKNANLGTDRGRKMLKQSLAELGAGRSILADKHGNVIAGNKTLETARDLKRQKVRVVQTTGDELIVVQRTDLDIDSKKARKLAVADNRVAEIDLQWNPEMLGKLDLELGDYFNDAELRKLLGPQDGDEGPAPQIDKAAELQTKWKTERGQIWEIGKHRLMCGDSTDGKDVDRLLGKTVPLILVSDPPYGVEYDPSWRQDAADAGLIGFHPSKDRLKSITSDDVVDWTKAWELFKGNIAYIWHGGLLTAELATSLIALKFSIRSQIIWRKTSFAISRGHYHWQHEPCLYAVRDGCGADWSGDRSQTTVWDMPAVSSHLGDSEEKPTPHATQKPVECMARPLRNHGKKGDCAYDPFAGSGTTIVAAEKNERHCYAMEIEPKYVAVALERMSDMGLKPRLAKS